MNLDEDKNLDHILTRADFNEGCEMDDEQRLSPKLVGAVVTPTVDSSSTQVMAPREGRLGVTQSGEGL